jgi:hypothetical protein
MAAGITCSNCGHSRSQHFFMIWQHDLHGDTSTIIVRFVIANNFENKKFMTR